MVINQLTIYPVKSLAGVSLKTMQFDELGAKYDRRYMLVNDVGDFITQRQFPRLCLLNVTAVDGGWIVSLAGQIVDEAIAKSNNLLQMFLPYTGHVSNKLSVNVWSDQVEAFEQGEAWQKFFSDYLGAPVRLVYLPSNATRRIDESYCPKQQFVSFADGFPLLLITDASLLALSEYVDGLDSLDVSRFRPNIVISGVEAAYVEDEWKHVVAQGEGGSSRAESGSNHFLVVKPCSRCVIPTINPETAERQPQVWKALAKTRKFDDGNVYFGQNLIQQNNAAIHLGQTLFVES